MKKLGTAAAAPVAQAAIPEGTVIGDGKLKINLARLDTRLLHGQVATAWTPDSKADRIIVASDSVAKDELRKELIKQSGTKWCEGKRCPNSKIDRRCKRSTFWRYPCFDLVWKHLKMLFAPSKVVFQLKP